MKKDVYYVATLVTALFAGDFTHTPDAFELFEHGITEAAICFQQNGFAVPPFPKKGMKLGMWPMHVLRVALTILLEHAEDDETRAVFNAHLADIDRSMRRSAA